MKINSTCCPGEKQEKTHCNCRGDHSTHTPPCLIIRGVQFQAVSDHRNPSFFPPSQTFWLYSPVDFHLIITIFTLLIVNTVRRNPKGETTNNKPLRCFTHYYFFSMLELASPRSLVLIIGCLYNAPNHMGTQIRSPRLHRFPPGWLCKQGFAFQMNWASCWFFMSWLLYCVPETYKILPTAWRCEDELIF